MLTRRRRVVILADARTHMMPALAIQMAQKGSDLVLGDVKAGLREELESIGAKVEVVSDALNITREGAVHSLVDRAQQVFGGFDAACIRTGVYGTGTILDATAEDAWVQYEGNLLSVFFALKALLPTLVEQGSGQVVINTSATGYRPVPYAALNSAMRGGANALIRAAGQEVAKYGVTVNCTGTYALDYASFLEEVGAFERPEQRKVAEADVPVGRLCKPEEAAHFVSGLIDGKNMFQTCQFFPIDGGWSFV